MTRRQMEIAGTERPSIKEIDSAAEAYREMRNKRQRMTEKEKVAKDALVGVMKKHRQDVYMDEGHSPPLVVTLVPGKDGVKVSDADKEDPGDDEEGGE